MKLLLRKYSPTFLYIYIQLLNIHICIVQWTTKVSTNTYRLSYIYLSRETRLAEKAKNSLIDIHLEKVSKIRILLVNALGQLYIRSWKTCHFCFNGRQRMMIARWYYRCLFAGRRIIHGIKKHLLRIITKDYRLFQWMFPWDGETLRISHVY